MLVKVGGLILALKLKIRLSQRAIIIHRAISIPATKRQLKSRMDDSHHEAGGVTSADKNRGVTTKWQPHVLFMKDLFNFVSKKQNIKSSPAAFPSP